MQNFSISTVALTTFVQWRAQYERISKRVSELHQTGTIIAPLFKKVIEYLDEFNLALEYYFSLKMHTQQTENLQILLDELQAFIVEIEPNPILSVILTELKATLIATKEALLKPLEIQKLPPEILNYIVKDNFSSRQALNLAQCSQLLFSGGADLSFLAKRKRLSELGKFTITMGVNTCFLSIQNKLFVWGRNAQGQLGLGDKENRNIPVELDLTRLQLAPEDGVAQVVAGADHTTILTRQGRYFVWGENQFGQLGLGDNNDRNSPVEFDRTRLKLAPGDGVAQVVTGENHSVLLTHQGRCFVWGENQFGQLGLGDNDDRNFPVEFDLDRLQLAPGDGVTKVIAGGAHNLLFTRQGWCFVWGANWSSQLGLGDNIDRNIPMKLNLAGLPIAREDGVAQVVAGGSHNILITHQGRYFVWGSNRQGQLGLGDHDDRNVPVECDLAVHLKLAPEDGVAQVVTGVCHNILLTRQGRCYFWGYNARHPLGLGGYDYKNIPMELNVSRLQLASGDGVAQVIAGIKYNTLLTRQGRCFVCENGELGVGYNSESASKPTEVFYPHLKELKNLWSSLEKEDLATLAPLACEDAFYGQTTYQLIIKRLAAESIQTRLTILPYLHRSPWHQSLLVTKLLPFASLYEPLVETLKVKFSKEQQLIAQALAKLLHLFNCFIDTESSAEQEDFIELLKILCQGRFQDNDDLNKILEKTALRHPKNSGMTFYLDARQQLLTEAQQQPDFLSHLTTAADVILQGLNAATEKDGMAYTLSAFLQPKQERRATLTSAGLG